MPRLRKELNEDKEFDEDFTFSFGFVLELMESISATKEFVAADTVRRVGALDIKELEARALRYRTRCLARQASRVELLRERAALQRDFEAAAGEFRALDQRQDELSALEQRCKVNIEDALLEMVAIVRRRIDVVMDRTDDGESLGFAAGALVLMERLLTEWRDGWAVNKAAVADVLRAATESIESFDVACAEVCAGSGLEFRSLRQIVDLNRWRRVA